MSYATLSAKPGRAIMIGTFVLTAQGCIPAVMHGPRIDPGFSWGMAGSYTAVPRLTRGDWGGIAYAYGPVGLNAGYGWTSDQTDGLGVRIGLHAPVLVVAAQPDLYVQLPKRVSLGLDAGVGVTAIPANTSVMPYGQIGFLNAAGSGLYATYGYLFGPDPSSANYSGHGGGAYVPGIAFQNVSGLTTNRVFVTAAIARVRTCPDGVSGCPRRDDWSVATGLALEFRRRRRGEDTP